MNPTQEQVGLTIAEIERQFIDERSREIEREINVWRNYCYENNVIPWPNQMEPLPAKKRSWIDWLIALVSR